MCWCGIYVCLWPVKTIHVVLWGYHNVIVEFNGLGWFYDVV